MYASLDINLMKDTHIHKISLYSLHCSAATSLGFDTINTELRWHGGTSESEDIKESPRTYAMNIWAFVQVVSCCTKAI